MEVTIEKIEKETAWEIRHKVMWPEKDLTYIKLTDDELGIHYGLIKENKVISVISLFINKEEAQFRKFATLQSEQAKGYGSLLLENTIVEAKKFGVKKIWCNARKNKVDFYKKFGLVETEINFTKGGKSYVIMEKEFGNK
ncbi:GNAT family N-acetyltransferase [Halalkalibacter krulwichiae]|uniref:Acetyltransferase (GNAT) family protein n=1 Tax=Halalkalibacter krulwichiae TaxID=199441 RepID=A0A1X9MG05_9BACI|nr:GNAT family N-acetyltransferase [Halalkalibacter krulwichiae]ARK30451.1 Acetyltransferase (GNAT) family protein [Halalkalibacter krulwichiae]